MRLTVLIADDEPLSREGLRIWLESDSDFGTIREARDGREVIDAIQAELPDLLFLDVQMPEMDGLAVVRQLGAQMPEVIFVTAHEEHAVTAFEINAIDYLLKPVTAARFREALERAKGRIALRLSGEESNSRVLALLEALASPQRSLKRLAVYAAGVTSFVNTEDIRWIRAAENYVEVHMAGGSHLVRMAINKLEGLLDPEFFLRIHRSIIVNCAFIRQIQPASHGEYLIAMADGSELRTGRSYRERIKALGDNLAP
jgi:two-component system, LytTR family, response regulator